MAAPTRDFAITYGSLTIGTGSSPDLPIHGAVDIVESHERFEISFQFVVTGSGPSEFNTNYETVRAAMRTPYQDLTVAVGDTSETATWYTFSKSSGTGFDARAEVSRVESRINTFQSALLEARISVELPADKQGSADGQYGRRETRVSIAKMGNGKRTVRISGTYTATDSANSGQQTGIEQFNARIDAYAAAVLASIDSTAVWEFLDQPSAEVEDSDTSNIGLGKICTFARDYVELLFQQGNGATAGSLDDTEISDQVFRVTRSRYNRDGKEELTQSTDLDRAAIFYSCKVDTSKTGAALVTKYENEIRPFIYDQARALLNIEATTVIEENFEPNFDENSLIVNMTVGGIAGAEGTFAEVEVSESFPDTGQQLIRFHTGDLLAAKPYQGPGTKERRVRVTEILTDMNENAAVERIANIFALPSTIVKSRSTTYNPTQIALNFQSNGPRFVRGTRTIEVVWEYFNLPGDAGEDPSVDLADLRGVVDENDGGIGI